MWTWDTKFGWGNIIQIVLILGGIIGGAFAFYYKTNATAERVAEQTKAMEELSDDLKDLAKVVNDNDKAMGVKIDTSTTGVKTEINLLRTEVVKIASDTAYQQRQIDDIKDELP